MSHMCMCALILHVPWALAVGQENLGRRWIELYRGLEENGAGPSGGVGERGIFNHRGQGQLLLLHGHILPYIG